MVSDPKLHVVGASTAVAPADRPDEELMVASAAGSREAFEVLATRYLPRLTSYCAKLARDLRAGEELAQDTLLVLWQRRAAYRPVRAFRVLAFTIALNRCRNHARSWRRRLRWLGAADDPDELERVAARDAGSVDQLIERERQRQVRVALARLPHRARAVLLLRFDQDLGYGEIAQIVGKPEVTVRSQVFHALRKLQRVLEEEAR